jgi:hypothetical protein
MQRFVPGCAQLHVGPQLLMFAAAHSGLAARIDGVKRRAVLSGPKLVEPLNGF